MAGDKENEALKKLDNLSAQELIRLAKASVINAIKAGKAGMAKELEHLLQLEKPQVKSNSNTTQTTTFPPLAPQEGNEEIGIPESLKIRRSYTMTPAAREQRRKAGKKRAEKCPNPNWKHGRYAESFITSLKPCKTTCTKYPCSLINEGATEPGETCLDVSSIIQTARAIYKAMEHKDYNDFNGIANLTISKSMHVLKTLLEDIVRDGPTIKREKHNSEGKVIGHDIIHHPALNVLPKMIADLGMTPQEFMLTPRALTKQHSEEEGVKTIADLMARVGSVVRNKSEDKNRKEPTP